MAIALVAHAIAQSPNSGGVTTTGVTTTGASLLVVAIASYNGITIPVGGALTDSNSNTWYYLPGFAGASTGIQFYFAVNPTVGAAHTFTVSAAGGSYLSLAMAAFSGTNAATPWQPILPDASGTVTSLQPGSVTPSVNGALAITAFGSGPSSSHSLTLAINSSYTITDQISSTNGNNGCILGFAYLVQATAAAVNPTWSWGGASTNGLAMATVFVPPAGGASAGTTGYGFAG
jgi:hypothetical protein